MPSFTNFYSGAVSAADYDPTPTRPTIRPHTVDGRVDPAYDAWVAEVLRLSRAAGVLPPESTERIACFELGLDPVKTVRAHTLVQLANAPRPAPTGDA